MTIRNRWRSVLLSVSLSALVFLISCTARDKDYRNRVAVQVNDSKLTAEQFSDLLLQKLKGFNVLSAKDTAIVAQAKTSVVQDFVVRVVTEDWAKAKMLFVRKEQLDEEIKRIRADYPDEISFRKSLADSGQSYEDFQEKLKQTLLERIVSDELKKQVDPVSKEQIKDYYQKNRTQFNQAPAVRLRQVLVENENSAKKILEAIKRGQKISQLAPKFSIGSEANLGGDLGWIEKGYLAAFDGAFRLGVGQRSSIVKSPFGYHIFEVIEKRSGKSLSLEESSKKIERLLFAQKEQDVYSRWLEEQVLKARVFKDDELIKHIQVHVRGN